MKKKLMLAASTTLLMSAPLAAANVNGFENFVLSRGDYKSSPSTAISGFSSRTHTESTWRLARFSSRKPSGTFIAIR